MQNKLKHFILAFLFLVLGIQAGHSQTYPVTISTQLTQPSPIYLSNYANMASINSPIKVQLILNDLSIMNRQVRLKCYFQGAVSFVTNDFVVGAAPIYLEGGFPTLLTNVELGSYFEFQNIKGINPNQYGQPLPEGIYTISFEVYDFATNKKLSKKSSATTVIFQNEPPFLNLPANQAEIMEQNIQNIIFSWTPRSINVSNVEYEFSLAEIWNTNTPIQNAFAYSPPLYTTTTRNTTVQYSIAEPQLIPGKTYAWRVKAKALLGAEEIGVFKNNGYSEIFSFKYLTFCKPPLAITTTEVSQEQAKVTWSGAVDNYDYQVNYREKNADSKWYKLVTPREYILISNLKPKTTYEYTVGAACDPNEYTNSNIQEFTTLAQDEIAFTGCGIKPDPTALSNKTPLPALFPNDVVTAGNFPIVVLKSTGSNGTFSGEGYVTFPFLVKFRELIDAAAALAGSDENGDSKANIGKYTRIRITFNNIGVNTDFKLISGEIIASYDPKWGSMIDGDKAVNDLLGDNGKVIPIDVQFEIKSVEKNADGTLTITGTNGVVVTQPKTDNDIIITDRNGKQYAVSPNAPVGNIESTGKAAPGGVPTPQNTNGMGSGGSITQISSPDVSITFAAGTGYYSLDENPNQDSKLKDNSKLNSTYDVIPKKDGTKYYVNYKAISDTPKAEDYITAKATFSNGKTAADVVFKTENGTEIPSTWSGNVATLTLKRTLDFAKESILATIKPPVQKDSVKVTAKYDIAGTLNMWHMTNKKVNVTLVGLNGGETPTQSQAQEYLNSIYGKAGIQFEVNTIKIDIAQSWGTSIETGDSDLLNTYTNGQQTITNDFQAQLGSSYKNNTYYVFFTGVPASKPDVLGFMPLKRQFGFVFTQSDDKKLRTLAHELGHGVFGLQHPFINYNTTVTTDLLMDYGTGTALSHNDWEIMHAPGLQFYQFTQGSSAGEQIASGYNYLMPNHQPFRFQTNDGKLDSDCINITSSNNGNFPNGTLYSFSINGKDYIFVNNGFYTKGIDLPYANAYNDSYTKKDFRLIIQQVANSCNYYFAVRKSINFGNPVLKILPTDALKTAKECSKIPILNNPDNISNSVLNTLAKIKTAVELNTNLLMKDLPPPSNATVEKDIIVDGMKYNFIQVEIQNNVTEIHPNGKITRIQNKNSYNTVLYGLDIDGNIQVYVDKEQVEFMYNYLMSIKSDNFILFVNGYDPAKISDDNNEVFEYDKIDYWGSIDDKFATVINSKSHLIYADGNKDINTSNHKNTCNFVNSLTSIEKDYAVTAKILGTLSGPFSAALSLKCTSVMAEPYHNTVPNTTGFDSRKADGEAAAKNFIKKLEDGTISCSKTIKDGKMTVHGVVDIVAHSMGFAYSLGMIEVLQKKGIEIGNYYVIAPENACSGSIPNSIRNRTWQYGSDETTTKENPIEIQDGVAPQCAIGGIDPLKRIHIPKGRPKDKLGFTLSHSINNYEWIFNQPKNNGDVKQRD
jgi:hypothetical protein